jgi:hypothetical protein
MLMVLCHQKSFKQKNMQNSQDELVAKLKQAQNVLVTVSRDPSVDQLSAAIGLTVALNNLNKHASAVFSGQIPSTMEFLQPEETLEKNTDSLRDFIIALDKSKADKLRYKVEDSVVRIFITPYKTSISQDDLEFSQGDFNVDVVVALGVQAQQDLDDAIQAHGRILHDAVVATVMLDGQSDLGTLHVNGDGSTSLSELVANMLTKLDKKVIDSQAATALLTGIVSITERFRNDKTTPNTMSISSLLMAAGANQQLIANALEAEPVEELTLPPLDQDSQDIVIDETGTLAINHTEEEPEVSFQEEPEPAATKEPLSEPAAQQPASPEQTSYDATDGGLVGQSNSPYPNTRGRVIQPPSHGGTLTANTEEERLDKPTEELTLPAQQQTPMLSHDTPLSPIEQPITDARVSEPAPQPQVVSLPPQDQPVAPYEAPLPTVVTSADVSPPAPVATSPAPAVSVPLTPDFVPNAPVVEQPLQPAFVPEPAAFEQPATPAPQSQLQPQAQPDSLPPAPVPSEPDPLVKTLADLEREIGVVHEGGGGEAPDVPTVDQVSDTTAQQAQENDAEAARKAVEAALAGLNTTNPEPIVALNAQPLGNDLRPDASSEPAPVDPFAVDLPAQEPTLVADPNYERPDSPSSFPGVIPESHQENEGEAAPPVPPPFVPPTA